MSPILGVLASGITKSKIPTVSYESIASATGTGSSGTITFSSIPSTYTSLQIRYFATSSVTGSSLRLRFNGDTGTNYAFHSVAGLGTGTITTGALASFSAILLGDWSNGTVNTYGNVGITDIHDYTSTTRNKTIREFGGLEQNNNASGVFLNSGLWINTSSINSITFYLASGNFNTTTQVSLYGIKGA